LDGDVPTGGTPIPQEGEPRFRWFCPKPTVKILFYTDDSFSVNLNAEVDDSSNEFGVRILHDLLVNDASDLADFEITLLDRHATGHASDKLTTQVLASFDQVWFFGIGLANTSSQPENELTGPEVSALEAWMASGGVLMTGDHANPRPTNADPNLDRLLGLGRAIGHRVPRAGALRRWEGNPAQFDTELEVQLRTFGQAHPLGPTYSYNTQVPTQQVHIDSLDLQEDEWPQELILKTYPVPSGPLGLTHPFGEHVVHRLFCGRRAPITVFPDHMHEGELVTPSSFPSDTWPSGPSGQPVPEVIARGTDKRNGRVYDIVTAYDGSSAGAGRIVADSTWHHYFNVNLKGFRPDGPVLPQLAQFFVNLAVWLSPPAKRHAIACWQLWKLAHNPTVQMSYRNPLGILGRAAAGVLRRTSGPCVIRDLVVQPVMTQRGSPSDAFGPPQELLLGGVLHAYLEAFERADAGDESARGAGTDALVARGLRAAHEDFAATLQEAAAGAERALASLEERQARRDNGP
jgi:hypothetical protein